MVVTVRASGAPSFLANVAQYEFESIEALKNKLAQFPVETKFQLRILGSEPSTTRALETELRTFLLEHEMILVAAN